MTSETAPAPHCKVAGVIGTETNFELLLPDHGDEPEWVHAASRVHLGGRDLAQWWPASGEKIVARAEIGPLLWPLADLPVEVMLKMLRQVTMPWRKADKDGQRLNSATNQGFA